ncbi:MFS transporter [Algoriphagus sediminis]|uniref:MFS transporter n=1 Tax=Algoriphagus sediminis TaxID=3057113 RepID=A0ABT7Y9W1_9BACT|nr:MFS transporter [Algoriphagus sediminis]MDN3203297.1 MFS transporter [Algoriphagus sediminis]
MHSFGKRKLALGSLFFFLGLCFGSWASRIPDIQSNFDLSEGELGSLLLCLPFGSLIGLPIAGWLVHQYGSKVVITIGGIFYAVSLALVGWSPSPWVLVPILVFFGLLGNVMNIAVNTQAIALEDDVGKSIIATFHGLWSSAGFVGAGVGAGMILLSLNPAIHFSIIMGFSVLVLLTARPFIVKEKNTHAGGGLIIKKPDDLLLRVGMISFLGMMCEGCMFDWSGVYFKKVVMADPSWVITGYVVFMGAMSSGRFLSDLLTRKIGKIKIIRFSGFLIFTGLAIAVLFPTFWVSTFAFLLVGFGVAAIVPMSYSIAGRSRLYSPGVALALVSTIAFFGFLIGPPLIGFIADIFNLQVSFALIALNGLGIMILSSYRKEVFEVNTQKLS